MVRLLTAALCLAGFFLLSCTTPAAACGLGTCHTTARDYGWGKPAATSRPRRTYRKRAVRSRTVRNRVYVQRRQARQDRPSAAVQRLGPPIANTPVAAVAGVVEGAAQVVTQTTQSLIDASHAAVEAVSTTLSTPFGTKIKTVSFMRDVPSDIAQFLSRVAQECGQVRVISTVRRGARIAGSRRQSCHATGQAVDYQVANPTCALNMARGVRLGHSTDYVGVQRLYGRGMPQHYHVSNCRQEMGVRFAHGGRGVRSTRYARRHARGVRTARHYRGARYASVRSSYRRSVQ